MRIYSNVCERCGGLKTASFASGIIQHNTVKLCDCPQPPPVPKHDGKLYDRNEGVVRYGAMYPGEIGVYIDCAGDRVYISVRQALSLLAWLQQEKPILDRLLEEEGPRD